MKNSKTWFMLFNFVLRIALVYIATIIDKTS